MNAEKKLTEQKREDIIEAAVREFKDRGFSATSMDCIAASAQVSKRTVYNHFESKEALFKVISKEMCDRYMQVSEHTYDPVIPIRTQLQHIAKQEMALLTSDEFLGTTKMILAVSLALPELSKTVDDFQENSVGVVKWVKQAAKDGALVVDDPVHAGMQFIALIEAFAFWPQVFGMPALSSKKKQEQVIESAVEMFLNTYAAE